MANKYAEHSKAKRRRSSPGEIIRFRKCTLKQSFGTRADAEQVAAARGMRAYRCSFCKQFHLTSKPPR